MTGKEALYLAGPECFYINGTEKLRAMRMETETYGFSVTLPNDNPLKLDHEDLRLNADAIFQNCADSMNRSTGILCDLEFYRGAEPDGGSIYEIGMAYARNIRCYGYTRDRRAMKWKYQGFEMKNGVPHDRKGRILPYYELPFSPNVIGSTKIIEGDFHDCLKAYLADLEEERKYGTTPFPRPSEEKTLSVDQPVIYFAGPERYAPDAEAFYNRVSEYSRSKGFYPITPFTRPVVESVESDDPYAQAYADFLNNQQNVRNCDIMVADLSDFHGWEPESDTSFECGMAFQLGKKLYGIMDDTRIMRERVPNLGEEHSWRDICGCNAENFDYPINLMFASSMPIEQMSVFEVIDRMAEEMFEK